ncbi:MAG: hypothetical protein H6936_10510 [Burkholderiales bacterium]|nr:hypothetical protein [Nitrosomonas sp.]MCP5275259.1 hypothetical protein [Burkholderiales bacterium]
MKTITLIATLSIFFLLTSCAQMNSHPMDMTQAIQSAKKSSDHEALANHYDAVADEMRSKAQEHQNKLESYRKNTYRYGKQAQMLQDHCRNLIRLYEQAGDENKAIAETHRKMAEELK